VSDSSRYNVVFLGRLVDGFDRERVHAALRKTYGESVAGRILSGKRVILKNGVALEAAEKTQRRLASIGLQTELDPVPPEPAELKLVDDTPADSEKAPPREEKAAAATKPRAVYPLRKIDESFTAGAEVGSTVSHGYKGYLAIVAFLMILLPVVYLAVVAAFAYGTWWHATSNLDWISGYASKLTLVGYLAPLAGGVLLIGFMLKPILASPVETGPQPVQLDPQREPAIFHLVERITEELGAPMPERILVDADVNASASLSKGVFSSDLTLTIGMPLFYGMKVDQLTGVLAHEFGHFAQRYGMRAGALIHAINYWFIRQAYHRDTWDELIESWSQEDSVLANLTAMVASIGAWLTRKLLVALAYLATAISRGLSRQMEFDADRFEVELCGSEAYREHAEIIRLLAAAHGTAIELVSHNAESSGLPENLPLLTKAVTDSFNERARASIIAGIESVNKSVFDTHPPDQERIAAARELDRSGIFANDDPACWLLREPHRLANHVTLQCYRSFGLDVGPDDLLPNKQVLPQFAAVSP